MQVNESYEELSNIKVQMFHGHSPRHILRNLMFHKISRSNTASYICGSRTDYFGGASAFEIWCHIQHKKLYYHPIAD